jgi:L-galactose dehydrogenase/L-glyceraldehyde 3-phosphate reductase
MRHRPFGRSGLQVSELVFGGGWVGGLLIHQDDETKLRALRRALDAGINWIDTAPSYGDGRSEEALGWLLREVDRKPYLSTKVRLDLGKLDDISGQVEASLESSLERLRRDSVDLLQLHNPVASRTGERAIGIDRVLGKGGVADALEHMREQGLTKLIGITALGEGAACKQAIASGRFDSAQVYYNLLNPSAGQAMPAAWSGQDFSRLLDACRKEGVATMIIRVLAAGVLASEQRHGRENQITEDADLETEAARARVVFQALGDRYGTRAQTAIRFALANPDVTCVLVGMAEPSHLEEALAAAETGPLPQDALDRLTPLYARDFDRPSRDFDRP